MTLRTSTAAAVAVGGRNCTGVQFAIRLHYFTYAYFFQVDTLPRTVHPARGIPLLVAVC